MPPCPFCHWKKPLPWLAPIGRVFPPISPSSRLRRVSDLWSYGEVGKVGVARTGPSRNARGKEARKEAPPGKSPINPTGALGLPLRGRACQWAPYASAWSKNGASGPVPVQILNSTQLNSTGQGRARRGRSSGRRIEMQRPCLWCRRPRLRCSWQRREGSPVSICRRWCRSARLSP